MREAIGLGFLLVGGALGAIHRYQLGRWISHERLPGWAGMLAANTLGAFLLGLTYGWASVTDSSLEALISRGVGIGYCGALTTFSSYMLEASALHNELKWADLVKLVGVSTLLGGGMMGLGYGGALWMMNV